MALWDSCHAVQYPTKRESNSCSFELLFQLDAGQHIFILVVSLFSFSCVSIVVSPVGPSLVVIAHPELFVVSDQTLIFICEQHLLETGLMTISQTVFVNSIGR